jgi:hypothetical protein
MHEHGLIKRALKKHQKKMNITQIDVKDIKLGILSRYQYSAKDVVTGVSFFCYAFKICTGNFRAFERIWDKSS